MSVTLLYKITLEITFYCFSYVLCVRSKKINAIHSQGRESYKGMSRKESWWERGTPERLPTTCPVW